MIFLVF